MTSVQIKHVPEHTHAVLQRRAAQAHQSLQEYLLARLIADADALSLDEALERAGNRAGGHFGFTDAVRSIQDERAGR